MTLSWNFVCKIVLAISSSYINTTFLYLFKQKSLNFLHEPSCPFWRSPWLNRQKKRLDCLFSLQKVYRFVLLKNLRILAKMCPRGCDFWLGIENNYLRRQQKDFLFMPDLHRSRQYYGSKVSLFFYFVSEAQKFKNYFFFVFTSWAIAPKL